MRSLCSAAILPSARISCAVHVGTKRGVMTGTLGGPMGCFGSLTSAGASLGCVEALAGPSIISLINLSVSAILSDVVSRYVSGAFRSIFTLPTKERCPWVRAIWPSSTAASVCSVPK